MAVSDGANVANGSNAEENSKANEIDVNTHKQTFTLEILQITKEAQQQHGLRHGDYQRYRSYCGRRLRRIRKSLHFVQASKHRFQPKKVTKEILSDVRYLLIPLMNAERAWAYAMQLKQEANTEPRKRFHQISRLRKAVKHAEQLEELCESDICDARTKLEAKAYVSWLTGTLNFELQNWQTAMTCFHKAQTIYDKLSTALNEEESALYKQRVDELTPNVRYCAYNIGDKSAINDLMQLRLSGKAIGEDLLSTNLDNLIAQTREKQAVTLSEVTWLGRSVPVRQEKVRIFLLNVQESEAEVKKAETHEARIAIYERLLLECKDVVQLLRDELKADQTHRNRQMGDGTVSGLMFLHSYLVYIRLSKTIERNLEMIDVLKKNLDPENESTGTAKKAKPQDLIRPYEIIVQNLSEILQLSGVDQDSPFAEEIKAQILAYKAQRCYYIAQTFGLVKKWNETMALYQRAADYCNQALSAGSLNQNMKRSVEDLLQAIEGQKYSVHALSILGSEDLSGPASKTAMAEKPLLERLDEYYEDPSLVSGHPRIAVFPPNFKPIPCKPLFFDLALNHVEFPSLDDKLEQKKGGGITGFVKGWLGGWKK